MDCHGATGKGGVRLEDLEKLELNERLEVPNKVALRLVPGDTLNQNLATLEMEPVVAPVTEHGVRCAG
jgi:hypothetical protein